MFIFFIKALGSRESHKLSHYGDREVFNISFGMAEGSCNVLNDILNHPGNDCGV